MATGDFLNINLDVTWYSVHKRQGARDWFGATAKTPSGCLLGDLTWTDPHHWMVINSGKKRVSQEFWILDKQKQSLERKANRVTGSKFIKQIVNICCGPGTIPRFWRCSSEQKFVLIGIHSSWEGWQYIKNNYVILFQVMNDRSRKKDKWEKRVELFCWTGWSKRPLLGSSWLEIG